MRWNFIAFLQDVRWIFADSGKSSGCHWTLTLEDFEGPIVFSSKLMMRRVCEGHLSVGPGFEIDLIPNLKASITSMFICCFIPS